GKNVQGFEALQTASQQAAAQGQYDEAVALARRAFRAATTPDERALACNREAVAHDGLGRFSDALEAEQRGLAERPVMREIRGMLEANLANAYYTLSAFPEAESLSYKLVESYRTTPPATYRDRAIEAFANYVLGNTLRELAVQDAPANFER